MPSYRPYCRQHRLWKPNKLFGLLDEVSRALGRYDGCPIHPCSSNTFVRKEALLSAQIEGAWSALSDLLLYESDEAPGVLLDDVQEVSNYVAAMNFGPERLRDDMPLLNRLIRDIHGVLLGHGRGAIMQPGEYRWTQNWVGLAQEMLLTYRHHTTCCAQTHRSLNGPWVGLGNNWQAT